MLSPFARALTHGDIAAHLAEVCGADMSTTIFTITEEVLEGMAQ